MCKNFQDMRVGSNYHYFFFKKDNSVESSVFLFNSSRIWVFNNKVARVRQESEETETTLRERIQRLEMSRLELEEEISRVKNSNMVEKIQHEEQLSLAKQKIQADEV